MLSQLDDQILFFFNQSFTSDTMDKIAAILGVDYLWWVMIALVFLWGILRRDAAWRKTGILLAIIVFSTHILCTRILKPAIARARPCIVYAAVNEQGLTTDGQRAVRAPIGCGASSAFPSGHAANTMALAVGTIGFGHPVLGFFAFLFALANGFFRLYAGVHFPTDILAGFLIGGFLGWLFTRQFAPRISLFRKS